MLTKIQIKIVISSILFGGAFLFTDCTKGANIEKSPNRDSDPYELIRLLENTTVENKLIQYSRGTWSNSLDYDSNHLYERLNIAFMTDSHLDMGNTYASKQNVEDAIDFLNNVKTPISAIIEGGDLTTMVRNSKTEHINDLKRFFDIGWKSKMPLLFTKGNHDINTISVTPEMALTDKDWSEIWFDEAETKYHIVRNTKLNGNKSGYYYYDLTNWKVRIICIDCFDLDISKLNDSGTILYWGGTSYYIANEQLNWVANQALNFDDKEEKDWGVIVFTHYYRPSDNEGTSVEPIFESVYSKFNSMLSAFNQQGKYSEHYEFEPNGFYNISIEVDWSRYSRLDKKPYIICVLSGHIHADRYNSYSGINHIETANQFCGNGYSDIRLNRMAGTWTQNLFDILNIDLRERKIRVIRYGAGINCYGEGGDRFLPEGLSF